MATCHLCSPGDQDIPDAEILDHLRVIHPDAWDGRLERWPGDGAIVVYDTTLEPGDFGGER